MPNPVLLKNLSKRFSSRHDPRQTCLVVDRINLELNECELLAMAGPSACGTSTILKMIAGLERPTEGEIYVDGNRVEGVPLTARHVGFLAPGNTLLKNMTVADNLSLGLKASKLLGNDRRRRLERLVALMGLEDILDRSPGQLSRGQQRRVVLASVLSPQPRVLLLDDPFGGLDANDRDQLRADTRLWQRELNIPTIIATHDHLEALEMEDRIAILGEGRFQQIDTFQNIYNNPANAFVARFIARGDVFSGAPNERLSWAIGAGLPSPAGNILVSSTNGVEPVDEDQTTYVIVNSTFLGRPVRLEVASLEWGDSKLSLNRSSNNGLANSLPDNT